jgi:hypothetical protein
MSGKGQPKKYERVYTLGTSASLCSSFKARSASPIELDSEIRFGEKVGLNDVRVGRR